MNQVKALEKIVHDKIKTILRGPFFASLKKDPVSFEGYRVFVKQKYGSIAYFLDFLQKGVAVSSPYSPKIKQVFEENYKDEIGHFAGTLREEYSHENWRLRSLKEFGVTKDNLKNVQLLPNTLKHQEIMVRITRSDSFFELVGALLFLELFVVYEMLALIAAFERDLPDIFPKGAYDYKNFPHNVQEYWYSHASHDVWHFKQIREGLKTYFDERKVSPEDVALIEKGIDEVFQAKTALYSQELFDHISSQS